MKGFYLIECVIAMLIMSFILSAMVFISLKLYDDMLDVHHTILAKIINVSAKQAAMIGVGYDAQSYAAIVLPEAVVTVDKSTVTTCWQARERRCE